MYAHTPSHRWVYICICILTQGRNLTGQVSLHLRISAGSIVSLGDEPLLPTAGAALVLSAGNPCNHREGEGKESNGKCVLPSSFNKGSRALFRCQRYLLTPAASVAPGVGFANTGAVP